MDIEKNIEKVRDDFIGLKYYVYFESASCAPPLKPVVEAIEEWWRLLRAIVFQHVMPESPIDWKVEATKLVKAKESEICAINRLHEGLNIIKDIMTWNKGDNIVISNLSYPSTGATWLSLRKRGVELRQTKNFNGMITLSDWEKTIDEKTKLVCINRTEWASGLTYDVEAICKIAHEKGAFVVNDDLQALGALSIDIHKTNLDFYVSGFYKWQLGPVRPGMFYIREDLIPNFEPSYQEYGHVVVPTDVSGKMLGIDVGLEELPDHDNIKSYDYPLVKDARRFDRTLPFGMSKSIEWGVAAALKYLNDLGPENIQKRVRKLGGYLIDRLLDIGCKVWTPIEPEQRHGLISYTTGNYERDLKSQKAMAKQRILCGIRYQGGVGGIRVSTHFFNTEEEIEKLIKVQQDLMSR